MEQKNFDELESAVVEENKKVGAMPNFMKSSGSFALDYKKQLETSILDGTSPFLPNKDGFVDLKGAYNMRDNKLHHGLTQLMLKERQVELGAPTGAFVSLDTVLKAQKEGNVDCHIRKGEHGFDIQVKNSKTDETKTIKWFNISQIVNPENLKTYLDEQMAKRTQETNEYNKQNHPDWEEAKNPALKDMERPNENVLRANFVYPEEYLGQVFAAMSTGTKLMVSPKQEEHFKKTLIDSLNKKLENGDPDVFAIFKIASKANEICKKTVVHLNKDKNKEVNKEVKKTKEKEDPSFSR